MWRLFIREKFILLWRKRINYLVISFPTSTGYSSQISSFGRQGSEVRILSPRPIYRSGDPDTPLFLFSLPNLALSAIARLFGLPAHRPRLHCICDCFARATPVDDFTELFGAESIAALSPSYNVAPSQNILAARITTDGSRSLCLLHWGLVPFWSKGPDPKYSMINARADTLASKPAYREPFKRRRCLIAADGFYEWKKTGTTKQPHFIRLREGQPFAFAGLWDHWEAEGKAPIYSCSIITTDANALVANIHDRMPVILTPKHYAEWLDPNWNSTKELEKLLKPYSDLLMEAWTVSASLNNPRHNDAHLIKAML